MANLFVVDPTKKYQVNSAVTPLQSVFAVNAAALNVLVLAAIPGKRIRIMGVTGRSFDAAVSAALTLIDGSGGPEIELISAPGNLYGDGFHPIVDSGYGETSTGVGLYLNITGASGGAIMVYYIVYTPL